jgi:hypothetical protein
MFLHALAGALGGAMGHFNPLVVGVLLTVGAVLLRPASRRSTRSRAALVPRRERRYLADTVQAEEQADAIRQRAVGGVRRASTTVPLPRPGSAPPSPPARRKPPRGGGGFFLLLLAGLGSA